MKTFFEYLFESEQAPLYKCQNLYEWLVSIIDDENLSVPSGKVCDAFIDWCETNGIDNSDTSFDANDERLKTLFQTAQKYLHIETTSVGVISGIDIEKTNEKMSEKNLKDSLENICNKIKNI